MFYRGSYKMSTSLLQLTSFECDCEEHPSVLVLYSAETYSTNKIHELHKTQNE